MKRLPRKLFWYLHTHRLLSLSVVFLLAVSVVFLAGRHQPPPPESGRVPAANTLKPVATLPDTTPAAADPAQAVAASNCAQNGSGKLLLVSISQQHLWACDGTTLAKESAVTTGTSVVVNGVDDNTPTGTWHIYSKQTNLNLRGSDANGSWDDPVQYWMPYDGAIGFHDASWQTFPFGSSQYQTDGSHGCVHLPTDVAAWVYNWAPLGTTVTVRA